MNTDEVIDRGAALAQKYIIPVYNMVGGYQMIHAGLVIGATAAGPLGIAFAAALVSTGATALTAGMIESSVNLASAAYDGPEPDVDKALEIVGALNVPNKLLTIGGLFAGQDQERAIETGNIAFEVLNFGLSWASSIADHIDKGPAADELLTHLEVLTRRTADTVIGVSEWSEGKKAPMPIPVQPQLP